MVDRQDLFAGYCAVWEYAESRLGYEVHEGPDMQDVCMSDVKEINICSRTGLSSKKSSLLTLPVAMMVVKTERIIIAFLLLKRSMKLGSAASALQSGLGSSLMKNDMKSTKCSA